MAVNPFEFVNAINSTKENLFKTKGYTKKDYSAFLVNKAFSYYHDTIMIANEANRWLNDCPAETHYLFYLDIVDKGKRFTKWGKEIKDPNVAVIMKHYNYSNEKAREVVKLFSDEEIDKIRKMYYTGGSTENDSDLI